MNLLESLRLALNALNANKLRAMLTMLGIIIGVGAVITLMAVGTGVQAYITAQFQSMGSNLFFVIPGNFQQELKRPAEMTLKDVEALADPTQAPSVLRISPGTQGYARVSTPGKDKTVQISGVTPDYSLLRDWYPALGEFISADEEQTQARVAVLGQDIADYFFPENPMPLGEIVRIKGVPFRVIGVMEKRGGSSFGSEDEVIFVPFATATTRLFPSRTSRGEVRVRMMLVQATSEDRMEAAIAEVSQILRDRHRVLPGEPDDFSVISQSDIIGTFEQITGVLTVFLGAIAGISLLVGGIGIMNIMLVSVTERTREIGLRKAVGARRRDILMQFLVEAVMLSLAGGIIGILLGGAGAVLISYLMRENNFQAVLTLPAVLLATLFSAAVGLFFGIYPAQRAAALNPIDALRYE